MKWYQQSVNEVIKQLNSHSEYGLAHDQIQVLLKRYGYNALPEVAHETWLTIFFRQFKSPLIYILLIAAGIIYVVGQPESFDAFIISGILLFNAVIGTIQEGRTYSIIESLKHFIKTESVVIRSGDKKIIQDRDLVPGDIIIVQEGQRVPADARIIESTNLHVDESVLTGESAAVLKTTKTIAQEVILAEQQNMVFKGTYVLMGTGKAVVVGTGIHTEIGRIQKTVEEIKTDIPLRIELDRLSYIILLFILGFCIVLFTIGLLTGRPLQELLIMLTALFICVIPEGLPVVLTLVLVTGVHRMAKRYVLVKNLQAVEALGRTDVIVIDKTGTLTRNEMVVSRVFADDGVWEITGQGYFPEGVILHENKKVTTLEQTSAIAELGKAVNLLNNSQISLDERLHTFTIKGDPTEAALYVLSQKLGFSREKLEQQYSKLYEIPFDSLLQYHAGFFKHNNQCIIFITGSPEVIVNKCMNISEKVSRALDNFLNVGLRVIAVAKKNIPCEQMPDNVSEKDSMNILKNMLSTDLSFLGICGIQDSIRAEVAALITQARRAGIHLVMATGDHKKTAMYVAKKVGVYQDEDEALSGHELNQLSDQEVLDRLERITVYFRVSPHEKMRIIGLFHKKNKIIAMTGDGINDVPALVAADLGIAMGGIGTEVAKQAADIVLLDDSFANIITAVKQGRHIFYTLRRVILYFFATNMGEILIVLFAFIGGLPLPITAAQILWLNLVTDGFLDVALSMEPQDKDLLTHNDVRSTERLVDTPLLAKVLFMAIPMGIGSLMIFWYFYTSDLYYARTMTLITMAMFQWFNAWNCRSEDKSIVQLGLFTNKWLIAATCFVLFLQFVILEVPFMQKIFKTMPLGFFDFLLIITISMPIILLEELRKWLLRKQ